MIKFIWEKIVVFIYTFYGKEYGDAMSFGGNISNVNYLHERLEYWEKQYTDLGYKRISFETWVHHSHGVCDYRKELYIKETV